MDDRPQTIAMITRNNHHVNRPVEPEAIGELLSSLFSFETYRDHIGRTGSTARPFR